MWSPWSGGGLGQALAVTPRAGWTAPFLHRCDRESMVRARLQSVDASGVLTPFPEMPLALECAVMLSRFSRSYIERYRNHRFPHDLELRRGLIDFAPCDFVCSFSSPMTPDELQSYQDMRQLIEERNEFMASWGPVRGKGKPRRR